ncbi:hypothetical protein AVU67_gp01 [Ralstonia phage RSJ2]|uniref:Uncharacterized protein n=1 Tax=Ralstonia phage RSJ2 TaxID=1481785 RepID=A0A068Q6F6_9CAUD|nr:hypothetical protein AVU67_gp01 [Ralstonia phage RSJ2]BAP15807.1 hypothetical protein [Ralstonia phage RSJ2]
MRLPPGTVRTPFLRRGCNSRRTIMTKQDTTKGKTTQPKSDKDTPKVKPFALITNAAELNKAMKSAHTRLKSAYQDLHRVLVSAIVHSAKHNDPDMTTRAIEGTPNAARKQAMLAWACAYGPFSMGDKGKLVYDKTRAAAVQEKANVDAAIAEPYWEFAPEPTYHQFDLEAALARLLKQAEKAMGEAEQDKTKLSPEKLAALRALVKPTPEMVQSEAEAK